MPMDLFEVARLLLAGGVCLVASFVLSTLIIRIGIPKLDDGTRPGTPGTQQHPVLHGMLPESSSKAVFDIKSTGFWIGFCETLLIFALVFAGAFSALAIIIGAKQFVRKEEIKARPSYYLLGTLVNLCCAVLFASLARVWVTGTMFVGPAGF